jgi:hypothetical protein
MGIKLIKFKSDISRHITSLTNCIRLKTWPLSNRDSNRFSVIDIDKLNRIYQEIIYWERHFEGIVLLKNIFVFFLFHFCFCFLCFFSKFFVCLFFLDFCLICYVIFIYKSIIALLCRSIARIYANFTFVSML